MIPESEFWWFDIIIIFDWFVWHISQLYRRDSDVEAQISQVKRLNDKMKRICKTYLIGKTRSMCKLINWSITFIDDSHSYRQFLKKEIWLSDVTLVCSINYQSKCI
jgi:hypothetical protein